MQRLDDLFFVFIEAVAKLRPKVVVAENVKGLILKNARGYVNEIIKGFNSAGYTVQVFLLNAAKMGVPQSRERVFFIAQRKDYSNVKIRLAFHEPEILFGDVRSEEGVDLKPGSVLYDLAKYIKNSDRDLSYTSKRISRKNAYFSTPINHDIQPAYTITANGVTFRGCDHKLMTKADIIACQTFPVDYDFMKNKPQYVCGMSVPPVMAANVAAEVFEQIFRGRELAGR